MVHTGMMITFAIAGGVVGAVCCIRAIYLLYRCVILGERPDMMKELDLANLSEGEALEMAARRPTPAMNIASA